MFIRPSIRGVVCLAALVCALNAPARVAGQTKRGTGALEAKVRRLITASGAETAAVAFRDLQTGRELLINPDASFHAASTMKVPVMLEVYREAREGRLSLDERLAVKNEFKSIADGSTFSVSPADDSEQTLYRKVGSTETVRELLRLMITESSNLATDIIIERVTPERVMELMRRMDARGIRVLRGVEDGKAFERGLNNTTTARGLLLLLRAIAEGRAVSRAASKEMTDILLAQKFNEGIPAGLPAAARVAHKTGSITKIEHDAGIVYLPGRKPYVLVVLVRGIAEEARAHKLIADISRAVYEDVSQPR
ncbi:MAG: class A beta-lactamase-related serine hydrolase [Acidobacteriota bacterium]|nr:class A beta-lactamase-related serine hydrolase [Acidobacteriota bacterium]